MTESLLVLRNVFSVAGSVALARVIRDPVRVHLQTDALDPAFPERPEYAQGLRMMTARAASIHA